MSAVPPAFSHVHLLHCTRSSAPPPTFFQSLPPASRVLVDRKTPRLPSTTLFRSRTLSSSNSSRPKTPFSPISACCYATISVAYYKRRSLLCPLYHLLFPMCICCTAPDPPPRLPRSSSRFPLPGGCL